MKRIRQELARSCVGTTLPFIPEAHCVLKMDGRYIDATSNTSSYNKVKPDVLEIRPIDPEDTTERKPAWHRQYLEQWIMKNNIHNDLESLWNIREAYIRRLS